MIDSVQEGMKRNRFFKSLRFSQLLLLQVDAGKCFRQTISFLGDLSQALDKDSSLSSSNDGSFVSSSFKIISMKIQDLVLNSEVIPIDVKLEPTWLISCQSIEKELERLPEMQKQIANLNLSVEKKESEIRKQVDIAEAFQSKNLIISSKLAQLEMVSHIVHLTTFRIKEKRKICN